MTTNTIRCQEAVDRLTNMDEFLAGRRVRLRVSVDCPTCGNLFTGLYIEQRDEWEPILGDHVRAGVEAFYAANPGVPRSRNLRDLFPGLSV